MDQTGTYLTGGGGYGQQRGPRTPRIVPNPFDNSLLIQGTRNEYESITKLLRDIDVPPRQVLIEAKIYEVTLSGAFANGVAAFLNQQGKAGPAGASRLLSGSLAGGSLNFSVGALVGQSRELLAFMSSQELTQRARVMSAPSIIATDSVAASINVGNEVAYPDVASCDGSAIGRHIAICKQCELTKFGYHVKCDGATNPAGVVTLMINQEASTPSFPAPDAAIQSPSFSKRTLQTQVTVQDGDTIAIGGIISDSSTSTSVGIPLLHRIPLVGLAFGSKSISKERTELIIFLTPKVIYDMNDINDATEELKGGLRKLGKYIKDQ